MDTTKDIPRVKGHEASSVRSTSARALARLFVWTAIVAAAAPLAGRVIDVDEWTEARSSSFVLRSNADPARVAEIAQTLEVFRAAFAGLAPDLELRSPVPTRILAFRDEQSFSAFKRGEPGGGTRILGQFLTHPDGNFITLNADPRLLGGVGVVIHEYVHYLVSHNFPKVPRWFNEGLAEYYSTFAIEGDYAVIGRPVDRHIGWLRRNGRLDLADVLEAGGSSRHVEADAGHFYAVSWGLVHYLLSSGTGLGSKLAAFLADSSGDAPSALFEETFDLRLEDLEEELERYLLGEGPRAGSVDLVGLGNGSHVRLSRAAEADVLVDLGALVLRLGDEIEAGRLFELALAYEPESGDAHAELAHVRSIGRRLEEADVLFSQALELGPRDERSFVLYGRHLLGRVQEERSAGQADNVAALARRAVDAFRAATDLKPDFAEAWALLGAAHLVGGLDPASGIAGLERAISLLTGRVDLYFQLLQLELRNDGTDRARQLAEGPVRRLGGEEWGLRADEEIDRTLLLQQANRALRDGRVDEGRAFLAEAIAITTDPGLRHRLELDLERLGEDEGR